ncbi:MAG: hypothetical protein Roseis2KO_49950 [Roseivirga sp.]
MHAKHNPFLLLYWFILFSIVSGNFAKGLGIPYLFLDPVYLDKVGWWGFMILGVTLCGFAMAYNITSYILDSFRFPFLGTLRKPFTHFCLNNALLPITFLILHVIKIYQFQTQVELRTSLEAITGIGGLLFGYTAMLTLLLAYFMNTNRDLVAQLARRKRRKKKRTTAQKKNAFRKLRKLKRTRQPVDYYIKLNFRIASTRSYRENYDRLAILRVFMQNQRNAILIQSLIFAVIILLGVFQKSAAFQIPAAASGVLLLTVLVMLTGAMSLWFRAWVGTAVIGMVLGSSLILSLGWFSYEYPAYGLDYNAERPVYSVETVRENASLENIEQSRQHMLKVLDNWRAKFGEEKPKMVLVTVSGGGQRSALWSLNVLQHADSVLDESLMDNTMLITGASGGLFGAAYYRDLYMHKVDRNHPERLQELGTEVLNPIMFTLLVNDLLFKVRNFEYGGFTYKRERGYEFEQRIKSNLNDLLDHPLSYYRSPEVNGEIPLLMVSPTITNDGRKLYISPQPTAFFNLGLDQEQSKVQGVDFRSLLKDQNPDSLRFLTALRMSATFPYITPTISLPTTPPVQIADAGISDNYGISNAMVFLHVFEEWILENTSQVVLVAIRDSEKEGDISSGKSSNILEKFFSPIQGVLRSWDQIQTIKNEQQFILVKGLYGPHLERVDFAYTESSGDNNAVRASLNWRLTESEKRNIIEAIHNGDNQQSLARLDSIFHDNR